MDNLKILIVEDAPITAMDIQEQLSEFGYQDTFIAGDSDTAIHLFANQSIDFVLMDIKLEGSLIDGITLIEIFNNIRKVPVIYLTSHDENHIIQRATKTNPANYLLKNCPKEQLKIAINLAKNTFSTENTLENAEFFIKDEKRSQKKLLQSKVTFHKLNGVLDIRDVEDIVYCEADGAVTKVFLKDYKQDEKKKDLPSFTAMKNLGFYEQAEQIREASFFRVRSNLLLNLTYIKNYNPADKVVTLTNGRTLIASREGGKALKNAL